VQKELVVQENDDGTIEILFTDSISYQNYRRSSNASNGLELDTVLSEDYEEESMELEAISNDVKQGDLPNNNRKMSY
jgi:hypothetical protein